MPMLEWEYGYPVFWAVSLAASFTLWLLVSKFRKKMTIAKKAMKKTRGT
jgi:hypothetical protein